MNIVKSHLKISKYNGKAKLFGGDKLYILNTLKQNVTVNFDTFGAYFYKDFNIKNATVKPEYALFSASKELFDNDIGGGFDTGPYGTVKTRKLLEKMGTKCICAQKDILIIE